MKEIGAIYPWLTFNKEMIGKTFGQLTVIKEDADKNSAGNKYWICKCTCGREKSIRGNHLTSGSIKSCGQCYNDLTNQNFGSLLVIERTDKRQNGSVVWKCLCECGNIHYVTTAHLKNGSVSTCGKHSHRIDYTGQKFGKLTVIKDTGRINADNRTIWLCKCDCGNETEADSHILASGNKKSCGCISRSYGEEIIENILRENQIDYIKEYSFEDLKGEKGWKLRFDFAIFLNSNLHCLIEFNGIQHYQPVSTFGGEESFYKQKINDEAKIQYCRQNKIPLYIIPYTDINKINDDYIKDLIFCK